MKYCNDDYKHTGQRLATYISYWPEHMDEIYSCPECYSKFKDDIGKNYMPEEVYKLVPLFPFNDPIVCRR